MGTPLPIPVFYVYVRGPWYFFTRLLHFTSSKSNRNKARPMPQELWVTNTDFGGRPAEAAVAVKFVHKGIPRQKSSEKTGKCGGGGLPLPVCLPPSSSTRLSLPSHLVIELGIETINELRCLSRLPKKRKRLQKQLTACRVKEDHPTLCDDAEAAVFVWPYGRASRDCQGFCPFVSRCMCLRACDNHCLLYTSPSPRDRQKSRMPSSA